MCQPKNRLYRPGVSSDSGSKHLRLKRSLGRAAKRERQKRNELLAKNGGHLPESVLGRSLDVERLLLLSASRLG